MPFLLLLLLFFFEKKRGIKGLVYYVGLLFFPLCRAWGIESEDDFFCFWKKKIEWGREAFGESLVSLWRARSSFLPVFFLSSFCFWLGFIFFMGFVWTKLLKGGSERGGSGKDRMWADSVDPMGQWHVCACADAMLFLLSGLGFLVLLPLPSVPLTPVPFLSISLSGLEYFLVVG